MHRLLHFRLTGRISISVKTFAILISYSLELVDITEDINEMFKERKLSLLTLLQMATASVYGWNFGSS